MKSSYSGYQGNCIDVSIAGDGPWKGLVAIQETDEPDETIYTTPENFAAFVRGVKDGEFDEFTIVIERADG